VPMTAVAQKSTVIVTRLQLEGLRLGVCGRFTRSRGHRRVSDKSTLVVVDLAAHGRSM
jgi:hypothetical protein